MEPKKFIVGALLTGFLLGLLPSFVILSQTRQSLTARAYPAPYPCGADRCKRDLDCKRADSGIAAYAIAPTPRCVPMSCQGTIKVCVY